MGKQVEKPIRVAHVMGKMVGGGVESVVMNYYRHIDHQKVQFDFFVDEDSTNVPEKEIKKLGGKIFYIPSYTHPIKYIKTLKKLLQDNKYRVVHSHINTLSVLPLYTAKKAGVPRRISHSHSTAGRGKGELLRNAIKYTLRPFSKRYATNYFACSEYAGKWLFGKNIINNPNFYLMKNAIDIEKLKFDAKKRTAVRKKLGINEDTFVIGHIGRFMPQKNHSFLIDVFEKIVEKRPDSVLLLVGEGPLFADVKEKVEHLNLVDKVIFTGQTDDVPGLIMTMDAFCLPSLYEGLGIVLIEAQAAGLPCIVSNSVPTETNITNDIKFFSTSNVKTWVDETVKISKPNRHEKMKCNMDKYDIKREALELQGIYEAVNENRTKVLQIGMTSNIGGIESFLCNTNNSINTDDFSMDFINIDTRPLAYQAALEANGCAIYNITHHFRNPIGYMLDLYRVIRRGNYQVIHCNMNSAAIILPLICSKASGSDHIIAHAHNSSSDKGIIKEIAHRFGRTLIPVLADTYLACSQEAADWFFSESTQKSDDFFMQRNGVDVSTFSFRKTVRDKKRKELRFGPNILLVGHVGRFNRQKNHKYLLEVFYEINKINPDVRLLLVGGGPLKSNIIKLAQKLNISEKMTILSGRNDVNELLQAMDIFIMPSLYEGLSFAAVEAQVSGLHCIFSDTISSETSIANQQTTYMSTMINPRKWAVQAIKLLSRKYNRANTARAAIASDYNLSRATRTLEQIYQRETP
ncbi:hypothetical protein FACS189431_0310 [Alphaproteobacteria bacterium]|nr:hypothetical protein FACS189431_0310 [Alphaproteobacteria bacterium]